MHLPFPTWCFSFLPSPQTGCVCSATFPPPGLQGGFGEMLRKGLAPPGAAGKASPNRALEGRRDTRAAAVESLPVSRPPSIPHPHMDMLLVKHPPHTLFRSPAVAQDIGKSCHGSRPLCPSSPAASNPSLPILQQGHISQPSPSQHTQESNMWPAPTVQRGRKPARSWLSSNRSSQMPWHLGHWAQRPAKAPAHASTVSIRAWVTC